MFLLKNTRYVYYSSIVHRVRVNILVSNQAAHVGLKGAPWLLLKLYDDLSIIFLILTFIFLIFQTFFKTNLFSPAVPGYDEDDAGGAGHDINGRYGEELKQYLTENLDQVSVKDEHKVH